jgi:hypothetical protein
MRCFGPVGTQSAKTGRFGDEIMLYFCGRGSPSSPFGLCRARFAFGFARLRHAKPKAKRGGQGCPA